LLFLPYTCLHFAETNPEEFFVPYVWSLVVAMGGIPFTLSAITLFTPTRKHTCACAVAKAGPDCKPQQMPIGVPLLLPTLALCLVPLLPACSGPSARDGGLFACFPRELGPLNLLPLPLLLHSLLLLVLAGQLQCKCAKKQWHSQPLLATISAAGKEGV
jgi:hypothetical protein